MKRHSPFWEAEKGLSARPPLPRSRPTGGCRKGVLPRMGFHVLLNQGDLEDKRETGRKALQGLASAHGISGSLVSLQQEVLYETTVH